MYRRIVRPLLFKFSAESMHHFTIWVLRICRYIPFARMIMRGCYRVKDRSLERKLFGLHFANPVGLAAGYDKNAQCYDTLGDIGFGFVEIGTVTPRAQGGNPKPRCFRVISKRAIINRMGFNNEGKVRVARNLQRYNRRGVIIGGNIGKNTLTANQDAPKDYLSVFRGLYDYVDYFAVNVSCPNVANLTALQSKEGTSNILKDLKEFRKGQSDYRPILLKISPDLSKDQIDDMIEVAMAYKVDGIIATNTTTSRETIPQEIVDRIGKGGLSGDPLWGSSVELVRYISQKTQGKMPIVGVGGITSVERALEMLDAGASLIQLYSGMIYEGPALAKKICKALILSGKEKTE